jgi:hypothetical protein
MEVAKDKISRTFSANDIKKYWKDQQPYTGGSYFSYTDNFFPPSDDSLFSKNNGCYIDQIDGEEHAKEIPLDIEWKRANKIFTKYLVFDEKIELDDIKQGNLGNCYFLSAIAALTEFPELIYELFRTKEVQENGYYEIVLFIDGQWQVVIVDDYFPVKKNSENLVFAKPNGNEIWVLLLEKAWAKVNGGYSNTILGKSVDSFHALTGFPSRRYEHCDFKQEELWKILKTCNNIDNLMCVSAKSDKSIEQFNIETSHAYTLIDTKEIIYNGEEIKLLKIRNPWGYKEWNGDWSDNSPLWTEEIKNLIEYKNDDDGTFFMSYSDFLTIFEATSICFMMYDSNVKSFKVSDTDVSIPNIFNLYVPENTRFSISALTKHWRYNRHLINKTRPISLVLARYDIKQKKLFDVDGSFHPEENVHYVNLNLKKGLYVIWIFCDSNNSDEPKPENYIIRFISPSKYTVRYEHRDQKFEFIREMICQGVQQENKSEIESQSNSEFYSCCRNDFKQTGLGYKFVYNKVKSRWLLYNAVDSGLLNMCLFPPYMGMKTFEFQVPPGGFFTFVGMRTKLRGGYWFNLDCEYSVKPCNEGEDPTNSKQLDLREFIAIDIFQDEIDENYYDYISSSHENAIKKLSFEHIDTNKINIENLRESHPEVVKRLLELEPLENVPDLFWCKITYDNGYYIGEGKNGIREGRGCYFWHEDNDYYIGYYKNSMKEKFGRFYDGDFNMYFEGEMAQNDKNGRGTFYYDNGYYVGDFVKGKRHGQGTRYWSDGSRLEVPFVDGNMKGIGINYPADGSSPYEIEY